MSRRRRKKRYRQMIAALHAHFTAIGKCAEDLAWNLKIPQRPLIPHRPGCLCPRCIDFRVREKRA